MVPPMCLLPKKVQRRKWYDNWTSGQGCLQKYLPNILAMTDRICQVQELPEAWATLSCNI